MDDSCAVCAESLEWVAYGPCGHREVCSTCVARLRFICNDRRCCICKTESDFVFVTKALGDYTKTINDFSVFPSAPKEGQVQSYWYHEDTQAFFDDPDHYNMVKAMCRLSCSVCDKVDDQSKDVAKKKVKFRNIVQLKNHLFHHHKLVMCGLCLEGRKVFICEQKLYTRAQLKRHIHTGDSEVDGSETDRGGFAGHPSCEFCRNSFYGDNELFSHMTTDHYTCHMCQRQHPGQYEYYKNYDDLEMHFRRDHFICEDEACLAKKFVVFQSEAEMKRHNATEHGGRMSRAQRNAALQIPTSFRYRRSTERVHRRDRGSFNRESSEDQLSIAVEASLQMMNSASSSNAQEFPELGDTGDVAPIVQPHNANDSEPQSGYLQAISKLRNVSLEQSSFPPLPATSSTSQQNQTASLAKNTMANRLRGHIDRPALNSGQPSPSSGFPNLPVKVQNSRELFPSLTSSVQAKPAMNSGPLTSGYVDRPAVNLGHPSPASGFPDLPIKVKNSREPFPSLTSSVQAKPAINSGPSTSSYLSSIQAANGRAPVSTGTSNNHNGTKKITHSASAPDLVERSVDSFTSQFPPIAATRKTVTPTNDNQPPLNVENVQSANKSLVEKMRAALKFDEEKYNAFKEISGQYRQGLIYTVEYLYYVEQFGLSHLVLDLARLCPDPQKQKELLDTYNTNMRSNDSSLQNGTKKGKGKLTVADSITPKSSLADSFMNSVRELQARNTPDATVEELSKDGYRSSKATGKGKSQSELSTTNQIKSKTKDDTPSYSTSVGACFQNTGNDIGGSKQQRKTSKTHRLRLGDGSVDAYLNARKYGSDPEPELPEVTSNGGPSPVEGPPVRGVWRRGGGQKLFGTGK